MELPQQEGASLMTPFAVVVQRVSKCYGSKSTPIAVLDQLNMTVPKGAIYGLLGASGCGKTTLLNCILGRKRLDSGTIWVLGSCGGVLGSRIGYMPQSTALNLYLSIRETLIYFGWIFGMNTKEIENRSTFLLKLLLLPDENRLIDYLSEGQKRRVSLACALLHEPELLILDEPTAGVDPLLREIIWNHLVEISRSRQTTVIITTHYIEETRQADFIGLMRSGCLLAEESPVKLLRRYKCELLEEVFLKLSIIQNANHKRLSNKSDELKEIKSKSNEFGGTMPLNDQITNTTSSCFTNDAEMPNNLPVRESTLCMNHMKALVWSSYLRIFRDIPSLVFELVIPIVLVALSGSVGKLPDQNKIAIVNYEVTHASRCNYVLQCNSTTLSCNYLQYLEKSNFLFEYYDSEEKGIAAVQKGQYHAFLSIKQNFSSALRARLQNWRRTRSWDIESSEIDVFRDLSKKYTALYIKIRLEETFLKLIEDYLESCQINKSFINSPINIKQNIYGETDFNFTENIISAAILTSILFLGYSLSSGLMLAESNGGSLERSLISGVNDLEIVLGHIITEFTIVSLQSIIAMVFAFVVFGFTVRGNPWLVIIHILLAGLCGMCYGYLITSLITVEFLVAFIGIATYVSLTTLSGVLWPIQGMHPLIYHLAYILPITNPIESMRCILLKGWTLTEPAVYIGFITIIVWILLFLTLSILFRRLKNN